MFTEILITETRYGYLITNKELLCVRAIEKNDPLRGYGKRDISNSFPLAKAVGAIDSDPGMTPLLAFIGLHLLAAKGISFIKKGGCCLISGFLDPSFLRQRSEQGDSRHGGRTRCPICHGIVFRSVVISGIWGTCVTRTRVMASEPWFGVVCLVFPCFCFVKRTTIKQLYPNKRLSSFTEF
jgi:hypothetical protein